MAWYNTYRPQSFADVSGQKLVKSVLENALKFNKIKHGYLLSGPKGTGKTTLARIFANQLNNTTSNPEAKIDIIELDAASNTGVDSIRQLIESAKTSPFAGKYKVYIIDEVHMLSKSAMNALLKILEEPPQYLVFLLATTNPEKLLPTVLSRLTKLTLTSHIEQDIIDRLSFIANAEKMQIDLPSLKIIAKRSNGGQRDAINLLETLYSYGLESYNIDQTTTLLGLLPIDILIQTCTALVSSKFDNAIILIQKIEELGIDGESFLSQLLEFLLENSFLGDQKFDSLIIPIAEVLNLRLPINTVVSTLALLQVKLREKNGNITQFNPLQYEDSKPILENKAKLKTQEETTKSLETEIKTEINLVKKEQNNSNLEDFDKTGCDDLGNDLKKIESLVLSIKDQPSFPSMSKIFWSKIRVEKIENHQLVLSLDTPMFVEKLKNTNNKKLILDYLLLKTGQNFSLNTMVRSANSDDFEDLSADLLTINNQDDIQKNETIGQESKNSVYYNQEDNQQSDSNKLTITKTKSTQKYFYSVYLHLPSDTVYQANFDVSVVPIWSETITQEKFLPQKTSPKTNTTLEAFAEFGILE